MRLGTTQHNRYGRVEAVYQLVVRRASVGARDVKGNTPLHLACGEGGADVVRLLLAHGSPLDVSEKWLMLAVFLFSRLFMVLFFHNRLPG